MKKYLNLFFLLPFLFLVLTLSSCENLLIINETKLYKISFETNGGSPIETFRSCKIEKSPETQKEDARFAGWYLSANLTGTQVSFPFEPKEDTTLYAKWKQKYSVHFVTNGGTSVSDLKTDIIEICPDTTREGFYFDGWYESSDFGGQRIQFPYYPSEPVTIYAKWIKICHIQFETNGGSNVPELNTAIINSAPESIKTGYTLFGWYKEPELQNQVSFPFALTNDSILYAKWIPNKNTIYKVEHYKQNILLETNTDSYIFSESQNYYGTTDSLTQAASKVYKGFSAISFSQKYIAADGTTVVKIYYNRNKYTVTFDANGGSGNSVSQDFYYGCPEKLSNNTFTKTGYSFAGWATSKTGEVFYYNQDSFSPEQNLTLYAVWKEPKTVSYKVQHFQQTTALGNNYELITQDTQTLSGKTGELTNAVANKYTGFTAKTFSQTTINENGSTTVNIYYTRNQYTLTFNSNGGDGSMNSQIFYYGISQPLRTNTFEKSGYSFSGWSEYSNGILLYSDNQNISIETDTVLYAQWYYGITVSSAKIEDLDLTELSDSFTLQITGKITNSTLVLIAQKIANSNVEITLDLSKTQGLTTISPAAEEVSIFKDCTNLVSVILPPDLNTIGSFAFYKCTNLRYVYVPDSVQTIGNRAFSYCSSLESIELNEVETIGSLAFSYCKNLIYASIENTKTIGTYAFYSCSNLEELHLKNIEVIGSYSFSCNSKLTTTILINIDEIGNNSFNTCTNLSSIFVDAKTVGSCAFRECTSLTAVTFSGNLKKINNTSSYSIFNGCTVLTSVTFQNTEKWYYMISNNKYYLDVTNPANNASSLKYTSYIWYKE